MQCTPASDPDAYSLASPMALLPLGCKQLIVTGDNDVNVPPELTRAYATAAVEAGDPTQLLEFTVRPFREIVSPSDSFNNKCGHGLHLDLKQSLLCPQTEECAPVPDHFAVITPMHPVVWPRLSAELRRLLEPQPSL